MAAEINRLTGGGVDRVVDVDFGGNLQTTLQVLKPSGTVASYASRGDDKPSVPFRMFMFKNITVHAILVYTMAESAKTAAKADITQALRGGRLRPLITRLNEVRRDNAALQSDWSLRFHPTDNEQLLCYSKEAGDNLIMVVVNLDPRHTQSGWVDFDRAPAASYDLRDLVAAGHYTWTGQRNFVQLNPHTLPAHVFRVTRK